MEKTAAERSEPAKRPLCLMDPSATAPRPKGSRDESAITGKKLLSDFCSHISSVVVEYSKGKGKDGMNRGVTSVKGGDQK